MLLLLMCVCVVGLCPPFFYLNEKPLDDFEGGENTLLNCKTGVSPPPIMKNGEPWNWMYCMLRLLQWHRYMHKSLAKAVYLQKFHDGNAKNTLFHFRDHREWNKEKHHYFQSSVFVCCEEFSLSFSLNSSRSGGSLKESLKSLLLLSWSAVWTLS